jgi:hypothetical protein
MTVANTLAYYDTATITALKSFIVPNPDKNIPEQTFQLSQRKNYLKS